METLTHHAVVRCQQRGIKAEVVSVVQEYGTVSPRPGDAVAYELTPSQSGELIARLKKQIQLVEKATGVRVVAKGNTVLTTYKPNRKRRPGNGTKRQRSGATHQL